MWSRDKSKYKGIDCIKKVFKVTYYFLPGRLYLKFTERWVGSVSKITYFSVYIKYIPSRQSRNIFITTWTKSLHRFLFIPFRSERRGLDKRVIPLDYINTKWKYKRFYISATFRWVGYPPKRAKLPKIASFLNISMLIVVRRSYSNKHFLV